MRIGPSLLLKKGYKHATNAFEHCHCVDGLECQ